MRLAKILDAETFTNDQTKVITLNLVNPVTALFIEAKSLNNGSTPTAHGAASISKVELIDGSRILHSLSGKQIQMRAFYHFGKSPENVANFQDDVYNTAPLVIPFGRWLGDQKYAFDPIKFNNPQLRITIDIGAGGSAADAVILDIDALVFDGKAITPIGFLLAREHYNYALVSSAYEQIDLPTDRRLRSLFIMSAYTNKYPYDQYNEFKLSENNDQKIPFDQKTSHYMKFLAAMFGKCEEHIMASVDTSGVAVPCMPTYEVLGPPSGYGGTALYFTQTAGAGGTITIKGNASGQALFTAKGLAPHGGIILPFGDPKDDMDWYDMNGISKLQLRIKAGSSVGSGSTASVIVEQVEPY